MKVRAGWAVAVLFLVFSVCLAAGNQPITIVAFGKPKDPPRDVKFKRDVQRSKDVWYCATKLDDFKNDETHAIRTYNAKAGDIVQVFDANAGVAAVNPDKDDWFKVTFKRDVAERTFELEELRAYGHNPVQGNGGTKYTYEDADVKIELWWKSNLSDKVTSIHVTTVQ